LKEEIEVGHVIKRFAKKIMPSCLLTVYPFWFMSPVLFSRNSSTLTSSIDSDINGAYASAQMLKKMTWPWSRNMMLNAPIGESFWSLTNLSQALNSILIWLFTRLMNPFAAVALFVIVGWVLTGIVVYLIARHLKVGKFAAICGGLFCEMLPWIRERALVHTSYVWLCVPLLVLYLALRFFSDPNRKSFFLLIAAAIATMFFDLYWFWLSFWAAIFMGAVWLTHLRPSIRAWRFSFKLLLAFAPIISFAVGVFVYKSISLRMSESGSAFRPLLVSSLQEVNEYNGSLYRFIKPDYAHMFFPKAVGLVSPIDDVNYAGIFIVMGAVFGSVLAFLQKNRAVVSICLTAIFLTLLTLKTGNVFGIVEAFRYLMPGVRRFSRAGMIVEGLLCVLACYFVHQVLIRIYNRRLLSCVFALFLIVFVILDLNPTSRRYVQHDISNWNSIKSAISVSDRPVILELPPQFNLGYFPIHYLDLPQVRTLKDRDWFEKFRLHASLGEEDFVSFLQSRGITHVIVAKSDYENRILHYKWGKASSVSIDLTDSRFVYAAESPGEVPSVLLKVQAISSDVHCINCKPYEIEWFSVRQDFYTIGASDYNAANQIDPKFSWAYPSDNVKFQIVNSDKEKVEYETTIDFVPAFGVNAPPQVLSVSFGTEIYAVRLTAGVIARLTIVVPANELISIRPLLPCAVVSKVEPGNPDPRTLCFGISSVLIQQL
jgi:hypothetical protein